MPERSLNRVELIGRACADPETRYTGSGNPVTTLRIATGEQWKDKQSGEQQERTEFTRVKFFGRLAEVAGEYVRKGGRVWIEGSLRTDKFTDKDGVERYSTDVVAKDMIMLSGNEGRAHQSEGGGGRNERSGNGPRGGNGNGARQASSNRPQQARGAMNDERRGVPAGGFDDDTDDGPPF